MYESESVKIRSILHFEHMKLGKIAIYVVPNALGIRSAAPLTLLAAYITA